VYKDVYPNISRIFYSAKGTTRPFVDDVLASLNQNTDAFNNNPVHGQIASANNVAANAAAQIDNGIKF